MRKCPFCAMVSHSNDTCEWCRRPFDQYFDLRVITNNVPAKKPRKKANKYVQGAGLLILSALALYSLAMWKTGPDAAKLANSAVNPTSVANPGAANRGRTANVDVSGGSANLKTPTAGAAISASQSTDSSQKKGSPVAGQPSSGEGQAKLLSVHLTTQDDEAGNESAYGTVVIANNSDHDVSDFSLTLHVNNSDVALVPYQGDISFPMALTSKHIPPHGQLAVQVMSSAKYPNSPSPKTVLMQATLAGGSGTSSDTAEVQ